MCKEMPVNPVNKVVDPKRIIGKKCRAEEEERHGFGDPGSYLDLAKISTVIKWISLDHCMV
jgi:hypothetical protein